MSKDVATQTGIDMESPSVGPSKYVSVGKFYDIPLS